LATLSLELPHRSCSLSAVWNLEVVVWTIAGLAVVNTVALAWLIARSGDRKLSPDQLASLDRSGERSERAVRDEIARNREEGSSAARELREELNRLIQGVAGSISTQMTELAALQTTQFDSFRRQLQILTESNEQKLEQMRSVVEARLAALQQDNATKLEQMRATVDEKLHATLEQRLGESFKLVSERLEQVHSGLGEMRTLATGVGDLKKVLTNIRTRGCWGEVQLGNLLEQMLTPDQFARNVATVPRSNERVEYAIRLPGRDMPNTPVWLPIDAKFPQEEYQRLLDAQERGDVEAVEAAGEALERGVRLEAKKIAEKYLSPPHTTDFAIMFLPTEGLFAEVLRRPGLCDGILQQHRVVLSGPTTLAAVLSSLQMGFRTLAIEKRSSEVWNILGAVKTEFAKFGASLEKVQKKLQEATSSIEATAQRSRVLERKLRGAEDLPAPEAARILGEPEALIPGLHPVDSTAEEP
jgi:DNA recombination protein RmuC